MNNNTNGWYTRLWFIYMYVWKRKHQWNKPEWLTLLSYIVCEVLLFLRAIAYNLSLPRSPYCLHAKCSCSWLLPAAWIYIDDCTRQDDIIKWEHFPRYWPFARGIHRSPVNSPHNGQWRGALMFPLDCAWINARVNNRGAGDLRRHRAHYDVTVMEAGIRDMAK